MNPNMIPMRAPTFSIGEIPATQAGSRAKKGPEVKPYNSANAIVMGSDLLLYQSDRMRTAEIRVETAMTLNLRIISRKKNGAFVY
jgi:hypothetical protein